MTESDPTLHIRQSVSRNRRGEAYDLIKGLALEAGVMQYPTDGHGYDEFIKLLKSGEFKLELVETGE